MEYDYSQLGGYFITICTHNRRCVLGDIVDGRVVLSDVGKVVEEAWKGIPKHFESTKVDKFQIMPNHMHGIVDIKEMIPRGDVTLAPVKPCKGLINQTPTGHWSLMKQPGLPLGKIMRSFKAKCAKLIHKSCDASFRWHRNYHDHIIRDDIDRYFIEQYIELNPLMWELDRDNPASRMSLDILRARLRERHGLTGLALERVIEYESSYREWRDEIPTARQPSE